MQENSTSNFSRDPSPRNDYLVFARRYRPQTFADVLGHEPITKTLRHAILSQKTSHAYLFSGPRGTGKTTLARLFAKSLNCLSRKEHAEPCNACSSCREITESRSLDVQEIDGASHRGIDHVRAVTEAAAYAPTSSPFKIYIIDEAHMLTKEAWNALLKTLEEPPPPVKFFFATTEPHKIPPTIISRCQRFTLRRISHSLILAKLQKISRDIGISVDDNALLRLADYADGAFRDAESLFDQLLTFSGGSITEGVLEEVLGIAPFDWFLELDEAIKSADISIAYKISDRLFHEGKDIGHFINDLCEHFKTLLLLKLGIPLPTALAENRKEKLLELTQTLSQEHLIDTLSLLSEAQKGLASSSSERFLLEWLLISLIRITRKVPLPLIVKKLFELQEKAAQSPSSPQTVLEAHTEPASSPSPRPRKIPPQPSEELVHNEIVSATSSQQYPEQKEKPPKVPEKLVCHVERSDPLPSNTLQEEACRQENLLRFASVELGATLTKKPK